MDPGEYDNQLSKTQKEYDELLEKCKKIHEEEKKLSKIFLEKDSKLIKFKLAFRDYSNGKIKLSNFVESLTKIKPDWIKFHPKYIKSKNKKRELKKQYEKYVKENSKNIAKLLEEFKTNKGNQLSYFNLIYNMGTSNTDAILGNMVIMNQLSLQREREIYQMISSLQQQVQQQPPQQQQIQKQIQKQIQQIQQKNQQENQQKERNDDNFENTKEPFEDTEKKLNELVGNSFSFNPEDDNNLLRSLQPDNPL